METFIGLDIETTGLDPEIDDILEVAAVVYNPHTFEEIERYHSVVGYPYGPALLVVLQELRDLFERYPGAVLVGRNVGTFDRVFLERADPGITTILSHRNFDVSTVRMLFSLAFPNFVEPEFEGEQHRALDNVLNDKRLLEEQVNYLQDLFDN